MAAEPQLMIPLGEAHVPGHYGDPEREYLAATGRAAWMDASFLTIVSATGKDHIEYLNRRLSQRTLAMEPGDGLRANQLNGDGRMEADLELYRLSAETSWMVAPPAVGGEYLQFLADKYVFSEDAQFVDESKQRVLIALIGPETDRVLGELGLARPAGRIAEQAWNGGKVVLFESAFLAGAWVIAAAGELGEALRSTVAPLAEPLGFIPFDTIRIERGIAWLGPDLTQQSIPLEADLHSAIHPNKGCYPGQETIAKIVNLGHPARKLVGVRLGQSTAPGTKLLVDGKEIGTLTSATWSPRLGGEIGLAMVRWPQRVPGTKLLTADGTEATVCALPFE
jgi:hypothetical protein